MPRPWLLAAAVVVLGGAAHAAQYPAWGDTGWYYATGRYQCCDDAVAIAQGYSAQACENTGGFPKAPMGGGRRGSCQSQWTQDDAGAVLWRCSAEAALWCDNF